MTDIVSLNEQRAAKAEDARLWTALDLARAMLRDIETGKVKPAEIIVHYFEKNEDGSNEHRYYAAGVDHRSHLALLAVAQHQVINGWLKT